MQKPFSWQDHHKEADTFLSTLTRQLVQLAHFSYCSSLRPLNFLLGLRSSFFILFLDRPTISGESTLSSSCRFTASLFFLRSSSKSGLIWCDKKLNRFSYRKQQKIERLNQIMTACIILCLIPHSNGKICIPLYFLNLFFHSRRFTYPIIFFFYTYMYVEFLVCVEFYSYELICSDANSVRVNLHLVNSMYKLNFT